MSIFKLSTATGYRPPNYYELKGSWRLCLHELEREKADEAGFVQINHRSLALVAGVDARTAKRALVELDKAGYIQYFAKAGVAHLTRRMQEQLEHTQRTAKFYAQKVNLAYQNMMQHIAGFYKKAGDELNAKMSKIAALMHALCAKMLQKCTPLSGSERVSPPVNNRVIDTYISPPISPSHEPTQKMSLNDEREKYKKLETGPVELDASDQPQVSEREIEKNSFLLSSPEPTQEPKADKAKGEMQGMKALMGQVLPSLFGGGGNPEPEPPQKPKKDTPPVAAAPPKKVEMAPQTEKGMAVKAELDARIAALKINDTPEMKADRERRRAGEREADKRSEIIREKAVWAAYAPFMKGDAKKCVWAMYKEYFGDSPGHRDCNILSGMADSFGQLDDEKKREFMDAFLNHGEKAKSLTYILSILRNDGFKIAVGDER